MSSSIYRNPFLLGLLGPAYNLFGTVCVVSDFLLFTLFIFATLGILGAYVTDFHIVSGLYMNELLHKVALASLLGTVFGLILWAINMLFSGPAEGPGAGVVSPAGKFFITWVVMGVPAYFMLVYLVSRLNKRDLEAEEVIRQEKRKQRKGSGPPLINKDGGI
ncbi:hypothetical protein [Nitrospina watsonii]|uniref:Uncharacterized protein n=1 Tax=Nitrospina watsonii TaxID=1323948 RepID=A0ABN8VYI7_9BACT|nr:hypothetical protein [Nitrospina watsonii]CAI2718807.1 conserved membrane protein of unknown function [Nitrospina watsonii]